MSAPAVTIALSAKDNAAYLSAALDTLLAQTFGDFELIAVDDGSADATWEILQGYAARDARIIPVRNETNIGLAASLNRILAMARAPLIARADGDDVYHPERLARQVAFMAANPNVGVLGCGFRRIDSEGAVLKVESMLTGPRRIRLHWPFRNPILHPGAMFRLDVVRAVGGYDESFRRGQDTDLWTRLLHRTDFDIIPEPLVDWRRHPGASMWSTDLDNLRVGHEVRRRYLTCYLGREVSFREALAVFHLGRRYRPNEPGDTLIAEAALREFASRALLRERLDAVLEWRSYVARCLVTEAGFAPPAEARRLFATSLRWRPTLSGLRGVWGPVPIVRGTTQ